MNSFPIQEIVEGPFEGFVITKINGILLYSCYILLYSCPMKIEEQFNQMMDGLADRLNGRRLETLMLEKEN